MLFPFVEGETDLRHDDIVFIDTSGRRSVFHINNGKRFHLYKKLDELQEQLEPFGFIRCHRCYLINVRYIRSVKNYLVTLLSGDVFSVSRTRYGEVKQKVNERSDLS